MRIPLIHERAFIWSLTAAVFILDAIATQRGSPVGGMAAAAFFLALGVYCVQNFLGCRELHCAITGPGYLLAGALEVLLLAGVRAGGQGTPWAVFIAVTLLGFILEWAYASRTGRRFLDPRNRRRLP